MELSLSRESGRPRPQESVVASASSPSPTPLRVAVRCRQESLYLPGNPPRRKNSNCNLSMDEIVAH